MLDATAPHTRIDNAIIDNKLTRIGVYGLAVYTVIKRHLNWKTGQCNPSYGRIAKIIGIDRSTVMRYVKKLKDAGLISSTLQFTEDGAPKSNQFDFAPSEQKSTTAQKGSGTKPPPPVAQNPFPSRHRPPEQVLLNKLDITKDLPQTEKQKNCPHPFSEVVVFGGGITICNHCYELISLPESEAA
jgi:DNA-binding transcriptional ArsR family regulator